MPRDNFVMQERKDKFDALMGLLQGPPGPAGPEGPQGPAGADGTVEFDELTPAQRESLRGPAGPAGADGSPGAQGTPGADGVSPTISITDITGGHRLTITDAAHPQGVSMDIMDGATGPQGPTGPGVPAGGTDGDVLVKNGATDYAGRWTKTPPQMGSLAYIETTSSVSKQGGYKQGEYLVYNGQLYKATGTISPNETLTPGGNIQLITDGGINDLKSLMPIYEKGQHTVAEIPFFGWVTVSATALDCYASLPALLPKNSSITIESIGGVIARTSTGNNLPDVPTGSGLDLQIQNRGTILRIVIFKNDGYGVANNIIVNGMLQNVVFTIS